MPNGTRELEAASTDTRQHVGTPSHNIYIPDDDGERYTPPFQAPNPQKDRHLQPIRGQRQNLPHVQGV